MAHRTPSLHVGERNLRRFVLHELKRLGPAADLNHLDVSQTKTFDDVFYGLDFVGDISKWDVSGATSMQAMFKNCAFNGDISNWNVANVRVMDQMFRNSAFNGDVSKWDVSNVTTMNGMFAESAFNGDVSRWNTATVQLFARMFAQSAFNGDISTWDFAQAQNLDSMFRGCPWRGEMPALPADSKAQFMNFFDIAAAGQFKSPNMHHWFLALQGHEFGRLDWDHFAHARTTEARVESFFSIARRMHNDWCLAMSKQHESIAFDFTETSMR